MFPISTMSRPLGVSRSGFYVWRERAVSARSKADAALSERIRAIHAASRQTYGAPRIHAELIDEGFRVGRKARQEHRARLAQQARRVWLARPVRREPPARKAPRVNPAHRDQKASRGHKALRVSLARQVRPAPRERRAYQPLNSGSGGCCPNAVTSFLDGGHDQHRSLCWTAGLSRNRPPQRRLAGSHRPLGGSHTANVERDSKPEKGGALNPLRSSLFGLHRRERINFS